MSVSEQAAIDIVEEETRLTGFTIVGHAENIPGRSSYAVYVRDCGENLILENNNIRAGSGGSGLRGQSGTPGLDAPDNATEGEQGPLLGSRSASKTLKCPIRAVVADDMNAGRPMGQPS